MGKTFLGNIYYKVFMNTNKGNGVTAALTETEAYNRFTRTNEVQEIRFSCQLEELKKILDNKIKFSVDMGHFGGYYTLSKYSDISEIVFSTRELRKRAKKEIIEYYVGKGYRIDIKLNGFLHHNFYISWNHN